MFFKKDIYKSLRPKSGNSFLGMQFKKMADVDYGDALVYPRFKFLDADKQSQGNGIFETSDYQKILEIIGDRTLSIGDFFSYSKSNYQIIDIKVDILDIVIDYSNGHTDYYIGKAIPFNIEIHFYVRETNYWDITINFANKYRELKAKENLSLSEKAEMINSKIEAERCFKNLLSQLRNESFDRNLAYKIFMRYGVFKSDCEEHLRAIEFFEEALKIEPYDSELLFAIGLEYMILNNDQMAIQYLTMAADLGNTNASEYIDEYFPN